MAKSKSVRSTTNVEKAPKNANQAVQQWRALRSEVSKVTWPTREEAQRLTIAVTIGMVAMALFLFATDAFFRLVVDGLLGFELVWVVVSVIIAALLIFAFFRNGQEE